MKKSATQSRKQTLDIYPADHIVAKALDNYGTMEPENSHDLAQLVWKYFAQEITVALKEVQAALSPISSFQRSSGADPKPLTKP